MNISKITHRDESRIKVEFPYNQHIASLIKQVNDARWSKTHRAWHIPDTQDAFLKLSTLFPETKFEDIKPIAPLKSPIKEEKIQVQLKEYSPNHNSKIYVEVIGRKILIKMPKNDADVKFLLTLRYSKWDKTQYLWVVPNYPGNLEIIKNYFGNRLYDLKIHEEIENNLSAHILVNKNEVLIQKTNTKRLKLIFGYIPDLSKALKKIPYHSWDSKNKWWSIPYSEQFLSEIKQKISDLKLVLKYEEEKVVENRLARITPFDMPNYRYCPDEYLMKLTELRYSSKTIQTYKGLFEEFINFFPTYDIKTIDETLIIKFLRFLVTERKVSTSYQNQSINAIKFYYERVLGGQRKFYFIDRPIKEKTLPIVLSNEEVMEILKQTVNLKHKAILMVIYSSGLRISEAINLKIKDIDSQRMQIRVEQSKGKKDRYTLLSEKALLILREYFKVYRPKEWLFEGQTEGTQYATRSIQNIFKASALKAGIKKDVSVHTLRHSFATHLLENGTDIRYIQNLLGHESSKTTEIYTHITTKGFDQIKSPLDSWDI